MASGGGSIKKVSDIPAKGSDTGAPTIKIVSADTDGKAKEHDLNAEHKPTIVGGPSLTEKD